MSRNAFKELLKEVDTISRDMSKKKRTLEKKLSLKMTQIRSWLRDVEQEGLIEINNASPGYLEHSSTKKMIIDIANEMFSIAIVGQVSYFGAHINVDSIKVEFFEPSDNWIFSSGSLDRFYGSNFLTEDVFFEIMKDIIKNRMEHNDFAKMENL